MAKKSDIKLTDDQKSVIAKHFIKVIKDGHTFKAVDKDTLKLIVDEHTYTIDISVFGSGTDIFQLNLKNNENGTRFKVLYDHVKDVVLGIDILQHHATKLLNSVIDQEYTDQEFDELMGFGGALLERRGKKIDRIVDNIEDKPKRRFGKRK